jgi:hypothetical protein
MFHLFCQPLEEENDHGRGRAAEGAVENAGQDV